MASLHEQLFEQTAEEYETKVHNKVTVVGIGAVGMAAAFSILAQVNISQIIRNLRHI